MGLCWAIELALLVRALAALCVASKSADRFRLAHKDPGLGLAALESLATGVAENRRASSALLKPLVGSACAVGSAWRHRDEKMQCQGRGVSE